MLAGCDREDHRDRRAPQDRDHASQTVDRRRREDERRREAERRGHGHRDGHRRPLARDVAQPEPQAEHAPDHGESGHEEEQQCGLEEPPDRKRQSELPGEPGHQHETGTERGRDGAEAGEDREAEQRQGREHSVEGPPDRQPVRDEERDDRTLLDVGNESSQRLGHHARRVILEVVTGRRRARLRAHGRAERLAELGGLLVAQGGIFGEGLQRDGVELLRKRRAQVARGHRRAHDVVTQEDRRVRARERRLADEHLVQHEAEAVDVGGHGGRTALDPFRGDVQRRREELGRIRVFCRRPGDPEVADLRPVVLIEQDVRRLQVRVDDAAGVGEREASADPLDELHHVGEWQRARALDPLLQR